ncbi:CHASE2 domain-containing protein [Ideonella margarita]|uniref:CHASE2 domain-containing protein n=1 Tax=Ideonella margarita TaxID=2984191 RepID=A0ABU9C4A7_9BURK
MKGKLWMAALVSLTALVTEFITDASLQSEFFRHAAARMFVPYNAFTNALGDEARAARDQLLVVDIGAQTLARSRDGWPLSYGQHARILERVRRAKPKVLFIDFQFQAPRADDTLSQLGDTLCAFKADGIPVLMAAGSEAANGLLRPELEALRGSDGQRCFEKVSVTYVPSPIDHIAWTYPLKATVGDTELDSAALAIARHLRGEPLLDEHAHDPTMGLVWGTGPASNGPRWQAPAPAHQATEAHADTQANTHADANADGHYCREAAWQDMIPLRQVALRLLQIPADNRPFCPAHRSIEASSLTGPQTQAQASQLAEAMTQRAVLYGGSFDPNDFIASPLQGDLPGVFLHAQAADNLIRYGESWRRTNIGGRLGHQAEWPMTLGALFGMALLTLLLKDVVRFLRHRIRRVLAAARHCLRTWRRAAAASPAQAPEAAHHAVHTHHRSHFVTELRALLGRFGRVYLALMVALPMSLLLENVFWISVFGYSSALAFCLLGEVFASTEEVAAHEQSKASAISADTTAVTPAATGTSSAPHDTKAAS